AELLLEAGALALGPAALGDVARDEDDGRVPRVCAEAGALGLALDPAAVAVPEAVDDAIGGARGQDGLRHPGEVVGVDGLVDLAPDELLGPPAGRGGGRRALVEDGAVLRDDPDDVADPLDEGAPVPLARLEGLLGAVAHQALGDARREA